MDHIFRIIDANANRAREGLRVMEDGARFVLDDANLSECCKRTRHELQSAIGSLPFRETDLLESRDTPGDVGTSITTELEQSRSGIADVVSAACKRTTEALRSIEESAKTLGTNAHTFESVRYRVYEIEKQLMLKLAPGCPQWALCVLITEQLCVHHTPAAIIQRASAGGADCIQIREKNMGSAQLLEYAGSMVEICRNEGIHIIINDRVDIARLVNADGVHLGETDLPTRDARKILGHARWIGRTCSDQGSAALRIEEGADLCGLGPMFASNTKHKPALVGPELIKEYLENQSTRNTPHLAISGITPENINELVSIGCRGIAVSAAVCASQDPQRVCRSLVDAILEPTLRA